MIQPWWIGEAARDEWGPISPPPRHPTAAPRSAETREAERADVVRRRAIRAKRVMSPRIRIPRGTLLLSAAGSWEDVSWLSLLPGLGPALRCEAGPVRQQLRGREGAEDTKEALRGQEAVPPAPGRRGALLWVVQHFLKLVRLHLSQDQFQLDLALQHFCSSNERTELGVFSHCGSQDRPGVGHEVGVLAGWRRSSSSPGETRTWAALSAESSKQPRVPPWVPHLLHPGSLSRSLRWESGCSLSLIPLCPLVSPLPALCAPHPPFPPSIFWDSPYYLFFQFLAYFHLVL